jgi:hypothetical protein
MPVRARSCERQVEALAGMGIQSMPDNEPVVTDSWIHYEKCMRRIQDFLREVTVRDSEVWVCDVCLGSPDRPWIRAPLQIDSAQLIGRSIERAQCLVASIKGSLEHSVETSRHVMQDLLGKGGDAARLAPVAARIDALVQLRSELTRAAALAPFDYHPAVLMRWCGILRQSFGPGDPVVRVEVTTAYVL